MNVGLSHIVLLFPLYKAEKCENLAGEGRMLSCFP